MRQLNGHDASFLYADNTHANANVTLLHIYDQSTAPGGKVRFKSILAHIESRLAGSPRHQGVVARVTPLAQVANAAVLLASDLAAGMTATLANATGGAQID